MHSKKFVLLALAVSLGFIAYRSESAASGNACLASIWPRASTSAVQTVANSTGGVEAAPAWELKDLEGKPVKLSDYKGKVVILNFWATWCPPCREETPDLVALQNEYKDQGLVVIGVSLDEGGVAKVKSFASKMKINYPVVMGDGKTVEAYGNFQAIPSTFYIDRAGNLAGTHTGGADKAMFESAIKPLLAKPTANL